MHLFAGIDVVPGENRELFRTDAKKLGGQDMFDFRA